SSLYGSAVTTSLISARGPPRGTGGPARRPRCLSGGHLDDRALGDAELLGLDEQAVQHVAVAAAALDELEQRGRDGQVLDVLGADAGQDALELLAEGGAPVRPRGGDRGGHVGVLDEAVDGLAVADRA